ncbi:DUF1542 domain-containing protein, partial [Gemella sp. GH3]|uniref:DUF1542 domain-containing protein n=1 Tax=unclassified Gemella TaxID=2624949 RepID=UPI0015D076C7
MFDNKKREQRFSLRKYHFGVASVLIGTFVSLVAYSNATAQATSTSENEVTLSYNKEQDKESKVDDKVLNKKEKVAIFEPEKTPVADLLNLTIAEKSSVEAAIRKANPELPTESVVTVGNDGTTIIKYLDSTTDILTSEKTVVKKSKTPVESTSSFSDDLHEKDTNDTKNNDVPPVDNSGKDISEARSSFRSNNDETITDPTQNYKKYLGTGAGRLAKQIVFLDFSDTSAISNVGSGNTLQIGTKFVKEVVPGYEVTLEVTKLRPFNATELYRSRGGANYKANGKNYNNNTNAQANIILTTQGGYSSAKASGLNTGGKTVIEAQNNGDNVGVEFRVSAKLNGKVVPANVVLMTGEEPTASELEIYTTDGENFELLTELTSRDTRSSYTVNSYNDYFPDSAKKKTTSWFSTTWSEDPGWHTKNSRGENIDGLGTKVFGPIKSSISERQSVPVVLTRNASNIGVYLNSKGKQGAMLGFAIFDEGDAPASYGNATHSISKGNAADQQQPYLGKVAPDIDIITNNSSMTPWEGDDKSGTADEGTRQLLGDDTIVDKDGNNTNGNYSLKKADDSTYELTVIASNNGSANAYARAFIDFDGDGTFNTDAEASNIALVTGNNQKIKFTFHDIPQNIDLTKLTLGGRVRIALDRSDIENPTGLAYSGEVEDFQIQQTIPPRGTKKETIGNKGQQQSTTVVFNAYGKRMYDVNTNNALDSNKVYKFVVNGNEVNDTTLTVDNEGVYKLNNTTGEITFTPVSDFVGKAIGVVIRAWDTNGVSTGWTAEENSGLSNTNTVYGKTMDSSYIPEVIIPRVLTDNKQTTGKQGQTQNTTILFKQNNSNDNSTANENITPTNVNKIYLIDPFTNNKVSELIVAGKGKYELNQLTGDLTFTPESTFVGNHTISIGLDWNVGVDNLGNPVVRTAVASYTTTVTVDDEKPTVDSINNIIVEKDNQVNIPVVANDNIKVATVNVSGLPAGLIYDDQTKTIKGTASTPGNYIINVTATDVAGNVSDTVTFNINVVVKEELREKVGNGDQVHNSIDYVKADQDKKDKYDETIAEGRIVLNNPNANQDEINAAVNKINNALADLNGSENNAKEIALNNAKSDAKSEVDRVADAKKSEIDASNMTAEEKAKAKEEVEKEAEKAKNSIDQATTDNAISEAKEAGKETIKAVDATSKAKSDAKSEVDRVADAKKSEIDASNMTAEEKAKAKEEVEREAEKAKNSIDQATTDNAISEAKEAGKETIKAVDATSKAKSDAKSEVDRVADAKKSEIDASNMTAEEKAKAKAEVEKEAEKAKASIDQATTNEAVTEAKDNGKKAINAVDTTSKVKADAKTEIDRTAEAKKAEIDASNMTDEEKDKAKAEVEKEAEKAKNSIDQSTTNEAVTEAKDNGKSAIN